MSFGSNLRFLRTNKEMTQEELAERMAVSRQTVSKWESDNAYPEMEKLIALCDLFSCTMDALVRGDLTTAAENSPIPEAPTAAQVEQTETAHLYDAHMNRRAIFISAGVGMLLFSILFWLFLPGVLNSLIDTSSNIPGYIALSLCFGLFLAGIVLLVIQGIRHRKFMLMHPHIGTPYTEKQTQSFLRSVPVFIGIAVTCILMGQFWAMVILLLDQFLSMPSFAVSLWAGCHFFSALGVPMLVWPLMQRSKYHIEKYEKKAEKCPKKQ